MESEYYIFRDENAMNPPDWSRWENHVLAELKRLNANIEKVITDQHAANSEFSKKYLDLSNEINILKTKAAIVVAICSTGFGVFGSSMLSLGKWIFTAAMKGN